MKNLLVLLVLNLFLSLNVFSQIHIDSAGNAGVGTESPSANFDIEGTLQLKDGSEGDNLLLTSDADGNASWQNLSTEAIFGSTPSPDYSCLRPIANISTALHAHDAPVVYSNDHAFVVSDFNLYSIDVSDPFNPVFVDTISAGFNTYGLSIDGNFAYTVREELGGSPFAEIRKFDISNPSNISQVGSSGWGSSLDPRSAREIAVAGSHAYVLEQNLDIFLSLISYNLRVYNISGSPSLVGQLTLGSSAKSINILGNYAYYLEGNTIKVIDISSPSSPSLVNTVSTNPAPNDISILGNHAYVVGSGGIEVFDLSTASLPVSVGSSVIGAGKFISSVGEKLIISQFNTLRIMDVSTPSSPVELGFLSEISTSFSSSGMDISAEYAYLQDLASGNFNVVSINPCKQTLCIDPINGGITDQSLFWQSVNGTEIYNVNLGNVGIGTANMGGLFELGLDEGRKPSSNTWTITSDERLKNINGAYEKGLNEILQLDPIKYHYKNVGERTFEEQVLANENVGFSAQEVQKVFPESVGVDDDGYLNFNMHAILVAQINAIKEQQQIIEEQQRQIDQLNGINADQQKALTEHTEAIKELQAILKMQSRR